MEKRRAVTDARRLLHVVGNDHDRISAVQVVEGEWTGAKNAGSWMVVVTQGITGKEYGARAASRVDIESRLTKLGQAYRKDPKGRIDFGQFAWDKKK